MCIRDRTTDVPLNRWAVVEEEDGFYAASGKLPRTGARALVVETLVDRPVARRSDEHYMAVAFEEDVFLAPLLQA